MEIPRKFLLYHLEQGPNQSIKTSKNELMKARAADLPAARRTLGERLVARSSERWRGSLSLSRGRCTS